MLYKRLNADASGKSRGLLYSYSLRGALNRFPPCSLPGETGMSQQLQAVRCLVLLARVAEERRMGVSLPEHIVRMHSCHGIHAVNETRVS